MLCPSKIFSRPSPSRIYAIVLGAMLSLGLVATVDAQCLPNSYPGNQSFCLVSQGAPRQTTCMGMSMAGTFNIVSLQIRCNGGPHAGKIWNLTCTSPDGTKCNVSDFEFCNGLTQFNVGQHCTEPVMAANPAFMKPKAGKAAAMPLTLGSSVVLQMSCMEGLHPCPCTTAGGLPSTACCKGAEVCGCDPHVGAYCK